MSQQIDSPSFDPSALAMVHNPRSGPRHTRAGSQEVTPHLTTLIVESQLGVADGIVRRLSLLKNIQVIGRAATLREAEALARDGQPALVLLDLRLPDSQGANTLLTMQRCCPAAHVIVLTASACDLNSVAEELGIRAFLPKDAAAEMLLTTIRSLTAPGPADECLQLLTARECEVAKLAARGLSNYEIAESLFVSENTVKSHVAHILRKLKLRSRIHLAMQWNRLA